MKEPGRFDLTKHKPLYNCKCKNTPQELEDLLCLWGKQVVIFASMTGSYPALLESLTE
jgi:hypothetical protein